MSHAEHPLRSFYRATMPLAVREFLHGVRTGVKHGCYSALAGTAAFALNRTRIHERLQALAAVRMDERLDYPAQDIYLWCSSLTDIFRARGCRKEPETVRWIEQYVMPGDAFYDVGANVGAYSLIAAKVHPGQVSVYSFEPSFLTYSHLVRNIVHNRCETVITPFHLVLSDQNGIRHLRVSDPRPGAAMHNLLNGVAHEAPPPADGSTQAVLGVRLDDLIHQCGLRRPNHVKLDVDGHELFVLQGARETLRQESLRSVLMEVEVGNKESEESVALLEEAGFHIVERTQHKASPCWNYVFARS